MSDKALYDFAKRLAVQDDETYQKSLELYRLIKTKGFTASETTKMILCIDCASTLCASAIDFGEALKFSGLKMVEYKRKKQLFEKLLSLSKKINVNEICAQLELNDVIKCDVAALLTMYSKRIDFKDDVDSAHCIAMAIYQAFKHRKQKGAGVKQRLIALSKLNPTKWKAFEADWNEWIEKESPLKRNLKTNAKCEQSPVDCDQSSLAEEDNMSMPREAVELEPYEQWYDRMVTIAKAALAKGNTHALFK